MANNLKMADASVNAEADALSALLDGGYLRIYGGTQPATADTPTAETLLAELRFNATAAPAAVAGVLTFNAIAKDSSAKANGTATWFRALEADGTTTIFDGSVGLSGCDLNLNSVAIVTGVEVQVSSMTHTVPKALGG